MSEAPNDLRRVRAYVERLGLQEQAQLPPERVLCEALGLTRNRLRGVLGKLEAEGLIWRHVGKGTFLGQKPLANDPAAVLRLLSPREWVDAALVLEPGLARLAASRATQTDLADLDLCLVNMRQMDAKIWQLWDGRFHRGVAKAAHNLALLVAFDTLRPIHFDRSMFGDMAKRLEMLEMRDLSLKGHQAIVDAIRSRDPDGAAAAMHAHYLDFARHLFSGL